MAQVVESIGSPVSYYGDWRADEKRELDGYARGYRDLNEGDTVGEIIRWRRADGYAQYMVVCEEPLELAHITHGDGYEVEAALIRGLILEDIQDMVSRERSFKEMFAKQRVG